MPYPERDATYKHEPKFIDRMRADEGGGSDRPHWPNPSTAEIVNAKDDLRSKLPPFTGGAESGVGRLEKAEHMKVLRGEE